MAQPQVVTAQVAFRGGLYETDARPTAITVMKLAGLTALLYVIGAIMELAKTEYREATIQEQFNNTEGLTLTDESLINALYTLTVLAGLCCISSIPLCGYCGAKNNDSTLVNMFCFCSGLCACLSFLGVLSALVAVGPGVGPTCETWEELGLKKTGCYVRVSSLDLNECIYMLSNSLLYKCKAHP
mmetsp:Transcript_4584/g.6124  ORF Transcript_4584/g.6124 Transcript_4584/m.6124 type:complete len:185 (-) Transcript_4584:364-918(-)